MNTPLLVALLLAGFWAIRNPRLLLWFVLGLAAIAVGEFMPADTDFEKAASMALMLMGAFLVLTTSVFTALAMQKERNDG